jgi:hypothetical protein
MNKAKYLIFALLIIVINGCEKIDPTFAVKSKSNQMTTLVATFADGTGSFKPKEAEPYAENLTLEIPWYYPDGSYTETSLDSMFLSATFPNSAYMSPAFGLTDLTEPKTFTLTAQNGAEQNYVITAVRKKSSKALIESFKLNEANISCFVVTGNRVIIPFTTSDISSQTATVKLSYYAHISPDPSVARDYTNPVEFTVTADDGTTTVYTVQIGNAVKMAKGFSSCKLLWTQASGDLGFEDYRQISIAVSGDYFVLPNSNEWVGGSTMKYYNRFTGNYVGDMDVTGASGIYSVASDTNGVIVGINNLYAGMNVCLFKWNSVTSAPVLLAQSPDWTCVESLFYGRKLSVYGDLNGDAVIMSSTDGPNDWAPGPNRILKWTVHNGAIVSPNPESYVYPTSWSWVAKAVPTGSQPTDNYFVTSNGPVFLDYVNGSTNTKISSFSANYLEAPRSGMPALTYFEFNKGKYAAIADISEYSGAMHIFDVTDPSLIPTSSSGSNYAKFHVYDGSDEYIASPSPNWNITGEIAAGPVSADGFTMTLYFLVTNGGVAAYELSCLDPTAF